MVIEKLIMENTKALHALTDAVNAMAAAAGAEGLTELERRADEEAENARVEALKSEMDEARDILDEDPDAVTLDMVKAALLKLPQEDGRALLEHYKAKRLPELDTSKYAEVLEKAVKRAEQLAKDAA